MKLDLTAYDFVDFGCSKGGSIDFAKQVLGGKKGLGLDIDPRKVKKAIKLGYEAQVADITDIDKESKGSVDFVIMSHFLEHLSGIIDAEKCIRAAIKISDSFVFIQQPYFDADAYLFSLRMKMYWSHWTGHTCHMTSLDLFNILYSLFLEGKIKRYIIFYKERITDSDHSTILPLTAPIDQYEWDETLHEGKPKRLFYYPVYRETRAVAIIQSTDLPITISKIIEKDYIGFDSADLNLIR